APGVSPVVPGASTSAIQPVPRVAPGVSPVVPGASTSAIQPIPLVAPGVSPVVPGASTSAIQPIPLVAPGVSPVVPGASTSGIKPIPLVAPGVSPVVPGASTAGISPITPVAPGITPPIPGVTVAPPPGFVIPTATVPANAFGQQSGALVPEVFVPGLGFVPASSGIQPLPSVAPGVSPPLPPNVGVNPQLNGLLNNLYGYGGPYGYYSPGFVGGASSLNGSGLDTPVAGTGSLNSTPLENPAFIPNRASTPTVTTNAVLSRPDRAALLVQGSVTYVGNGNVSVQTPQGLMNFDLAQPSWAAGLEPGDIVTVRYVDRGTGYRPLATDVEPAK
ncbi:MAG: hypothetical protein ACYCW6_05970, partial [Candidatus Xenobia bacterium]